MYNFFFPFLFLSSSSVISLSLLVFLQISASLFAAAAKISPSSSPWPLSLFLSHTRLQLNKLAMMTEARRDQNANTNASTPKLTATILVLSTMTSKQTDLIFKLTNRKLEAKMAANEVEAKLTQERIVKVSEAQVADSVAAASAATTAASPARRPMADEEDDITGGVPTEVMSITFQFAGLPKEEIVIIFRTSSSRSTDIAFAIFVDSVSTPCMSRTTSASRMACRSSGKLQRPIRTLASLLTRCRPTPFTTKPQSSFLSLAGRSRTSTPPSPSSTPTSTSSSEYTSGKRRFFRWPLRLTPLLLHSNLQTRHSGSSGRNSKESSALREQ